MATPLVEEVVVTPLVEEVVVTPLVEEVVVTPLVEEVALRPSRDPVTVSEAPGIVTGFRDRRLRAFLNHRCWSGRSW